MTDDTKTGWYLVAIVAIVAVVALTVLVMGVSSVSSNQVDSGVSLTDDNMVGNAKRTNNECYTNEEGDLICGLGYTTNR